MGSKETIECQINCFSINHFYKTIDNNVIEFPLDLKRGTHLGFNAIKMLRKISLALLTQVET